jgi:hypothetical protein
MILFSIQYFEDYEYVRKIWERLQAPIFMIYPLAILRVAGVLVVILNRWPTLRILAYLGLALEFIFAITLHLIAADGMFGLAAFCLFLLLLSYFTDRQRQQLKKHTVE